jgi:hypothetical protein
MSNILIIDSTYKTNHYDLALVFVHCINENRNKIPIFCALLKRETSEAYSFIFEKLEIILKIVLILHIGLIFWYQIKMDEFAQLSTGFLI